MRNGWIEGAELKVALEGRGLDCPSDRRLERWRNHGLLEGVKQEPMRGGGSLVLHTPGTVERVALIIELQGEKDDLAWIARQMWWRGVPMAEQSWRPHLIGIATKLDPVLNRIRGIIASERDDDSDQDLDKPTLAEQAAPHVTTSGLGALVARRLPGTDMVPVARLILDAAGGLPPEFEPITNEASRSPDHAMLIKGTGLDRSDSDALFGKTLNLAGAIGFTLRDIGRGIGGGTLLDAANADRIEIERARDDLRAAQHIICALYQSTEWLFGKDAFGLRFAHRVATKSPPEAMQLMMLLWVLMRRVPNSLIPSDEIDKLRDQSSLMAEQFSQLRSLCERWKGKGNFLEKRRLKRVLSGIDPFAPLIRELESLRRC